MQIFFFPVPFAFLSECFNSMRLIQWQFRLYVRQTEACTKNWHYHFSLFSLYYRHIFTFSFGAGFWYSWGKQMREDNFFFPFPKRLSVHGDATRVLGWVQEEEQDAWPSAPPWRGAQSEVALHWLPWASLVIQQGLNLKKKKRSQESASCLYSNSCGLPGEERGRSAVRSRVAQDQDL